MAKGGFWQMKRAAVQKQRCGFSPNNAELGSFFPIDSKLYTSKEEREEPE